MSAPTPTEADKRAAEKLKDAFSIGTFSRFCDEPADFDDAELGDIAAIIAEVMQPEREALREAVKYLKAISKIGGNLPDDRLTNASGPNDARARGLMYISARECANKALTAIEKVIK